MKATNRVNLSSPTANMFGIEPCPKCGSQFRWMPYQAGPLVIHCDDCGLDEVVEPEQGE